MLTYVYGVVPMSLCRNGWCRAQSEPPETHKIQLEDLASCEYRHFDILGHMVRFRAYSLSHHQRRSWRQLAHLSMKNGSRGFKNLPLTAPLKLGK